MSYNAEIVDVAHPINWDCVKPALPNNDMIGCVDLLDVCTGGIKEYLTNFDISLKPNELWPKVPAVARVHCSDIDWDILGQKLVEYGLCDLVDGSEVFSWSNKKLLSGMFGVSKHEVDEMGVEIVDEILGRV